MSTRQDKRKVDETDEFGGFDIDFSDDKEQEGPADTPAVEQSVATESSAASLRYAVHPVASLFPMFGAAELQELADDIAKNGLRQSIVMQDKTILDGRNRLAGCKLAGVEPTFVQYSGDDPLGFIVSANIHRRHLTESQRAMVAAALATMRQGERTDLEPCKNSDKVSAGKAAELLNVSRQTVQDAKVVAREAPELVAKITSGKMTVHAAKKTLKPKPTPAAPDAKPDPTYEDTPSRVTVYLTRKQIGLIISDEATQGRNPADMIPVAVDFWLRRNVGK